MLQRRFAHLPVANADANARHQILNGGCAHVNAVHAIVDEIHLAAARDLLLDGGSDQIVAIVRHHGVDGQAILGRRFDHRHIAQAGQRHVQRARNRRGAHGEHVDVVLELFDALFVPNAEALLFVHHQQAEILEYHVLRKDAMRADDDVHFAFGQAFQYFGDFFLIAKAAEHFDAHRKGGKTALECFEVLVSKHRGGREHRGLLAVAQALERGAHGDLGLAVAHVAAQQPVHGMGALHVFLDLLDGRKLVFGFGEIEGVFEFALPVAVGRIS